MVSPDFGRTIPRPHRGAGAPKVSSLAEMGQPLSWLSRQAYTPRKWAVIVHLEIRSINPERAALPITATGYRSHFHECGTIEARGGDVVAQVTAWLDEEAASPEWQAHLARAKQGELFG